MLQLRGKRGREGTRILGEVVTMRERAEVLMLSGRVVRLALDKNDTVVAKAQADCPSESALKGSLSISRIRVSRRVAMLQSEEGR